MLFFSSKHLLASDPLVDVDVGQLGRHLAILCLNELAVVLRRRSVWLLQSVHLLVSEHGVIIAGHRIVVGEAVVVLHLHLLALDVDQLGRPWLGVATAGLPLRARRGSGRLAGRRWLPFRTRRPVYLSEYIIASGSGDGLLVDDIVLNHAPPHRLQRSILHAPVGEGAERAAFRFMDVLGTYLRRGCRWRAAGARSPSLWCSCTSWDSRNTTRCCSCLPSDQCLALA